MTDSEYLSCAATAKLVRVALKKAFPGIKFSVRSEIYAGGASMRVGWIDGPLCSQVDAVVSPYKGADFDGMIDMKISKRAWLMPDGSAVLASSPGTQGSMGTIPSEVGLKPSNLSRQVRFGSDFIFTERTFSVGLRERALAKAARYWGFDPSPYAVEPCKWSGSKLTGPTQTMVPNAGADVGTLVYRELVKRTNYIKQGENA